MVDPGFDIDELEDAHPLKIGYGTVASQRSFERLPVDNAAGGQASAKDALPNGRPEAIEQPRGEAAGRSLHPPIENDRR